MPEVTVRGSLLGTLHTHVLVRFRDEEGNRILLARKDIGDRQDGHLDPVGILCLGIIRAHDGKLLGMVVCSCSLTEVEFAVAHHILHARKLYVVRIDV